MVEKLSAPQNPEQSHVSNTMSERKRERDSLLKSIVVFSLVNQMLRPEGQRQRRRKWESTDGLFMVPDKNKMFNCSFLAVLGNLELTEVNRLASACSHTSPSYLNAQCLSYQFTSFCLFLHKHFQHLNLHLNLVSVLCLEESEIAPIYKTYSDELNDSKVKKKLYIELELSTLELRFPTHFKSQLCSLAHTWTTLGIVVITHATTTFSACLDDVDRVFIIKIRFECHM